MSKAIIEFNLPEEQDNFELAINASKYYVVLHSIERVIRNMIKYASDDVSNDYINALEKVRDELYNQLEENNLNLD